MAIITTPGGNIYDSTDGKKQDKDTALNRDARDLAMKQVADAAFDTANAFAGQIAQANETAGEAKAIAENAETDVGVIKGDFDTRLTAVETAAGYAPGDATDAAMTNIVTQPSSTFRSSLDGLIGEEFAEQLPPALDEVRGEIDAVRDVTTDIRGEVDVVRHVAEEVTPSTAPNALGSVMGAVASRDNMYVPIVCVGSSSVAGHGASTPAKRWVNRLAQMLHNTAPFDGGPHPVLSLSEAVAAAKPSRGHQFINAGVGGTTAENYITNTTRPQIAALAPRIMFHMVGSNDRAQGHTPEQFKTNMLAQLDQLNALISVPCTHVLVSQTDRIPPASNPAPWTDFIEVLREIAREQPQSVIMVDSATAFAANGVPGTDPLNLIGGDGVHCTDRGYALHAELIAHALDFPTRDARRTPGTFVRTSDSFNGANAATVVGRKTDQVGGGATPALWQGMTASAGITSNRLVRSPGPDTWFVGAPAHLTDYEVAFTVVTRPTVTVYLDVRRVGGEQGSASAYRLGINPTEIFLVKRSPGTGGSNTILGPSVPLVEGERIGLRCIGSQIALTRNGTATLAVTDSELSDGGWWGLAGVASSAGWVLDDLTIREYVS